MRSVQQSLHQAVDHAMTLEDLCQELHENMEVPEEALSRFRANVSAARADVTSAGGLLNLNKTQFDEMNGAALSECEVNTLCLVLGSATAPHRFPPAPQPAGDGSANLQQPPATAESTILTVASGNDHAAKGKKKGGSTTEVAETLLVRREHLIAGEYHVPLAFDKYHKSNPLTWACNGKEVRKLAVQEVLEVCGDLYADANERAVIFGAIEQFCGAPNGNGHFDNWKDPAGKKHKGTGVSDLEKARKNPAAYGVTNRCVPGRMRPARPPRPANAPPPSATFVPSGGPRRTSPATTATADDDAEPDELDPDAVDEHLSGERSLQDQVQQLAAKLKEVQEQKKAADAAKKAAQKAAKEAKEAAKKAATPATGQQANTKKGQKRKRRVIADEEEEEEAADAAEEAEEEEEVEEGAEAVAADEGDGESFDESDLAGGYEKLDYDEELFAFKQLVAVYAPAPEAKQWVLGHISAVNVNGKINGANEQAIWYRLGDTKSKKRKEFILCLTDGKDERHGIDFFFVQERAEVEVPEAAEAE